MPQRQQQDDGDFGDGAGDFLDDDHAAIVSFANNYLDEDERESFVDSLMERRGYQRVQSWAAPDPSPARRPALPGGGQGGRQGGARRQSGSPYFKR